MAEGFANCYGRDVLTASSVGLSPIASVPADTVQAMTEKNIDMSWHAPRRYDPLNVERYDLVVNLSGFKLPGPPPKELVEWQVPDPYGAPAEVYRAVRDDLEQRVMRLILELRRLKKLPG
jgi:arsenate reductase (thioredoxin)